MVKRFVTARDIDEYAERGVFEIQVDDDLVITDVGRERARERGVRLVRVPKGTTPPPASASAGSETPALAREKVREQVRAAVIAKLGGTPENLDAIINKILDGLT